MKLLKINQGQAIWLLNLHRPSGPLPLPKLCAYIAARYEFQRYPSALDELTADQLNFQLGEFQGVAIDRLGVYPDGAIVDTKANIEIADAFLQDALDWLTNEMDYEITEQPPLRKLYHSILEVRLEVDLDRWLHPVGELSTKLTEMVRGYCDFQKEYRPSGIYLNFDDPLGSGPGVGVFKLERRIAKPFDPTTYVTAAPLKTSDHLKFLELLERLAAA